jgi:hypothetical protein
MLQRKYFRLFVIAALVLGMSGLVALAGEDDDNGNRASNNCRNLPGYAQLKPVLDAAVAAEATGLNLHMWANDRRSRRDCVRCRFFGHGSRRTVARKPRYFCAESKHGEFLSLDSSSSSNGSGKPTGLALSTANLYSAVQPGGSLFGLQLSNPVETDNAYKGPSANFGKSNDPLVGSKVGGVNVFGGGLALYAVGQKVVGAVGLSGDTSCADHFIAWRVRKGLGLDHMLGVGGVSGDPNRPDNIIFDIIPNPTGGTGISPGGFGHPTCINTGNPATLDPVVP